LLRAIEGIRFFPIARRLSRSSVPSSCILRKRDAASRAQAAVIATQRGLV
jgi:hypothetical protein